MPTQEGEARAQDPHDLPLSHDSADSAAPVAYAEATR